MQMGLIDHKQCEVLLTQYREQAANLRHLNQLDLWCFLTYTALQFAITGFASIFVLNGSMAKVAIFLIDAGLLTVSLQVLGANQNRRVAIRTTILNINEALGLYAADVYLPNRAINPPYRPNNFVFFSFAYWMGFGCVTAALYFSGR